MDEVKPRGHVARIARPYAGWRVSGRPDLRVWSVRSRVLYVPNGSNSLGALFKGVWLALAHSLSHLH